MAKNYTPPAGHGCSPPPTDDGPTIPANRRPNPALDYVALRDAHAMAIRAFWRGVFFGAVGVAALGGLAGWLS